MAPLFLKSKADVCRCFNSVLKHFKVKNDDLNAGELKNSRTAVRVPTRQPKPKNHRLRNKAPQSLASTLTDFHPNNLSRYRTLQIKKYQIEWGIAETEEEDSSHKGDKACPAFVLVKKFNYNLIFRRSILRKRSQRIRWANFRLNSGSESNCVRV